MRSKKAQDEGKAVGVLILVIALFMILYMIFVPPEERERLLSENYTENPWPTGTGPVTIELLQETPGLVTPENQQKVEHNLMPVNLFIKTEPKIINLAQSLSVTKSTFSKSFPTLYFNTDMKDLKKVTLFFSVSAASGELRISVNGNQFYSQQLSSGVNLVDVPVTFLSQANNVLTFSVSSPGLAFWSSNSYQLSDVGLKQEYEMINSREERTFTVPTLEKDSIESSTLSYFQVCNMKLASGTSTLKIYLNDNPVPFVSTKVRCATTNQELEIDTDDLKAGQNTMLFVLEDGGDFTFNQVKVTDEAKFTDYPSYTFPVSRDQYAAVKNSNVLAQLELYLEDNKKAKNARISVNSGDIFMQTKSSNFTYNIKEYVEEGTNFLRIVPSNEFTITGMKVTLQ